MALGYILMCFIFGTTYMVIKVGLNEGIPPFLFASARFFIAGLIIIGYLLFKQKSFPTSKKMYMEIFVLSILMTAIPFSALFWAEQHVSSGEASLLVATAPIFIALMSKMNRMQWVGLVISVIGIYMILLKDLNTSAGSFESTVAKASIVFSELAFAFGAIRSRALLLEGLSPQMFNGLQMMIASLVLLALSFLTEKPVEVFWSTSSVLSLLYLAILPSVVASGIYYWLVKVTNPLFPSTWTYVSPIVAMLMGTVFLNEAISILGMIGGLFVLGGIVLMNLQLLKRERHHGVNNEREMSKV